MTKTFYQIQIALKGFKPKICRRVLIPSDISMSIFHYIIQAVMGWTNSHLHQFIQHGLFYCESQDGMCDDMDAENETLCRARLKAS